MDAGTSLPHSRPLPPDQQEPTVSSPREQIKASYTKPSLFQIPLQLNRPQDPVLTREIK